jgi:maltose O-acetyltransferase
MGILKIISLKYRTMTRWNARLLNKLERVLLPGAIDFAAYLQQKIRDRHHDRLKQSLKLCAPGVRFKADLSIAYPEHVSLGRNVYIGPNVQLDGRGGLTIDDYCTIGCNVVICSANHDYQSDALPYAHNVYILKPVTIERNVWIGANVLIVPGVTIGEGAIIAAGTVVSQNVAPLAIVGGAAMRVIKHRDRQHYDRLASQQIGRELAATDLALNLERDLADQSIILIESDAELPSSP